MSPVDISHADLVPFADLGTSVEAIESGFLLIRNASKIKVEPQASGYRVTNLGGAVERYSSAGDVLASVAFANLSRIAQNQVILLQPQRIMRRPVPIKSTMKEISGHVFNFESENVPWKALDIWLRKQ